MQEEAEEVARAAREEGGERVAEEAADVLYHLAVLLRGARPRARRRRGGAQWPSPLSRSCALGVSPALDEVRALAAEHNLVPVRHTFLEDCETPVSAFLKLRGAGPAFLLESAEQGQRVGRWSFIGYRPRRVVRWNLADGGDPYALAAAEVQRQRQAPLPNLPPFAGGAVGFFGYDCVRTVEPLGPPNEDTIGLPDLALMLTDALVAFDHLKHTVTILANAYVEEEGVEAGYERALGVIAEVRERLAGPLPRLAGAVGAEPQFEPNMPREAFEAMVARIVEYVHAGDAFQVVPVAALVGAGRRRRVLDLPRAARDQPVAVHVLPRLRGLPDRRRLARAAA